MDAYPSIRCITKEEYPELIAHMPHAPQMLYIQGEIPDHTYTYICIVGSRSYSQYGKDVCARLISGLRSLPVVIVSGLAIGIDAIAHECALEYNIKTIAVPGSGLHEHALYPSSHFTLARRIVASGGALISPFKPDQTGARWTFPIRNRLMAGMSHATLIIEARRGSGTLITADHALSFGRDVLAVPGSILSELSYGPHMLIERGARPITSSADIIDTLGLSSYVHTQDSSQIHTYIPSLSKEERSVCDILKNEQADASALAYMTQMTPSMLNSTLSRLELKGIIVERGGIYSISPLF